MRPNFFHHLHPPSIPAKQSRWRYTLGAGGIAVFLVAVLGVTGILEMFYYVPNPAEAALSVQTITFHVPFGWLVRNLHYWAGQALMVVSAIHLIRVVFTAAYARPRRFNYLLGLALFVLLIGLNFTGYILRWDESICWPLVTGTNLIKLVPLIGDWLYVLAVGGGNVCETALLRFYTWHLFGLMLPAAFLVGWHAFRVRRDGGIAVPSPSLRANSERITRFDLARREVVAMILTSAALILLAVFFPAPLAPPLTGKPILTAEASAPWFFLWVQQMLKWGDPLLWGVLVPAGILTLVALSPYIFPPPAPADLGLWFPKSNCPAQVILALIVVLILVLTFSNVR
jgi:quinol-cytochrome oxidoreductase complex cytochrome b subunit